MVKRTQTNGKTKKTSNGRTNGNGGPRVAPRSRMQNGQRRRNIGAATGTVSRNSMGGNFSGQQVQVISGTDFIGSVVMPKNPTETTARLLDIGLNPRELIGTRWAQMCSLYEKYRFTSLVFTYIPAVSSVVGAQIVSYFELDPSDVFGESGSLATDIRVANAHQNMKLHNIYDNVSISLPKVTGLKDFFTDSLINADPRLSQQARFRMLATAGMTGFYDTTQELFTVGTLRMSWVCRFFNPQIQPSILAPSSQSKTGLQGSPSLRILTLSNHLSGAISSPGVTGINYRNINGVRKLASWYSLDTTPLLPGTYTMNTFTETWDTTILHGAFTSVTDLMDDSFFVVRSAKAGWNKDDIERPVTRLLVAGVIGTPGPKYGLELVVLESSGFICLRFYQLGSIANDIKYRNTTDRFDDFDLPTVRVKIGAANESELTRINFRGLDQVYTI
jgi:hypothetical protein